MENSNKKTPADFLTVEEFKAKVGKAGIKASIVRNPNTNKVFMAIEELRFKCQADIDSTKPMSVLVPHEGGIDQACLVNVTSNENNVLFSL